MIENIRNYHLASCIATSAALFVFQSTGSAAIAQECTNTPVQFAHCSAKARNYRAVLLSVHGWRGKCNSTFGKNDHSLYRVLADKFYDIDCFEYDSQNFSINENVSRFHERLVELHRLGYRQAMLVTHSTGGVIALRYLAHHFLNGDALAGHNQRKPIHVNPQGLFIKSIHAWATPINGLRYEVSGLGRLAWFSPETLPDLKVGSPFLSNLYQDMAQLRNLIDTNAVEGSKMRVNITFYQGQNDDWVVRNISVIDAQNAGWWPEDARIVNTTSGHSHNIGESGGPGLPKYPAELTRQGALIGLDLMPRLDDIFPTNIEQISGDLETRQLNVIDGIAAYASRLFTKAYQQVAVFLKRVITDSFPRSQRVDERITGNLAKAVQKKLLGQIDASLVSVFDQIVSYIFDGYQVTSDGDLTRFGEGRSTVAQQIIKLLEDIRKSVRRFVAANAPDPSMFPYSGSYENFNTQMLNLQTQMLNSSHGPAQNAALQVLAISIPDYTASELALANFTEKFNTYNSSNYAKFNPTNLNSVSKVYENMLARGGDLSEKSFAFLNQLVPWQGMQRPQWTVVLENQVVRTTLEQNFQAFTPPSDSTFAFTAGVIAEGGASGNDLAAAKLAVTKAKQFLAIAPSNQKKFDWIQKLSESANDTSYPAVRLQVQKTIKDSIR